MHKVQVMNWSKVNWKASPFAQQG